MHKVKGLIPLINYLTAWLIILHLYFDIVEKYLSHITCYWDIMTRRKGGIGRHKGRSRSSNKKSISSAKKFSESDPKHILQKNHVKENTSLQHNNVTLKDTLVSTD